jgi:hypothetical protein
MTSSERHLRPGQSRWDYTKQEYKEGEPFCEEGLFSILVLAHGRPEITKRCILSTVDVLSNYPDEIEWIFIENGNCKENLSFFQTLPLDRKVIISQRNYGINHALNQAWALSRGQWCMIHENDWECRSNQEFLGITKDILTERSEVGIVQLRAINDPCENWGRGKPEYSPWTCSSDKLEKAGVNLWPEKTSKDHEYWLTDMPNGFNNNPCVISKALYKECGPYPEAQVGCDPRHGETLYQQRVAGTDCVTAHVGIELYYHCGQKTTLAT